MNEEEFEEIFSQGIQDIFGTNKDDLILEEITVKAASFKTMQEILEYMNSVMGKISSYNEDKVLEVLFKNLSIETLDENFTELLGILDEYKKSNDWFKHRTVNNIILGIPKEVKTGRFEELSEFVLDEENLLEPEYKLLILYELPVSFKEPEKYKRILDLLETVGPEKHFYKTEVKKRIIKALPKEFVFENYEDVLKELFSITEISENDILNFIENTFSSDTEIDEEMLEERFELLKEQLDKMSKSPNELKIEAYSNLVNYLPKSLLKERVEEFMPLIDKDLYEAFFKKIFEHDQDEEIDNELMLKNIALVDEIIKQKESYEHIITKEHLKIVNFLPNEFIKKNVITCLETFNGETYKELLPKFLENIDRNNYEELKNTINWLAENSLDKLGGYDYKKEEIFLLIVESLSADFAKENFDLVVNTFDTESFKRVYPKVFEFAEDEPIDNELVLNNVKLAANFIKSKNQYDYIITSNFESIIALLPESFLKRNSIACLETFNASVYKDLILKIIKEPKKEDYEEISTVISWLGENADSKFGTNTYDKKELFKTIADLLPSDFIRENLDLMINTFEPQIIKNAYEKIFEVRENENIDNGLTLKNMKLIVEQIKTKNQYDHVITEACEGIIALLPESFIKENSITCFEIFNASSYKALVQKIIKEPKKEDYEEISTLISWLGENADSKFGTNTYDKDELFKTITNLLPSDFVKDNLNVLVNNFKINDLENLYEKIFETKENEEIDNEVMTKNVTMLLEHIEKQQLRPYEHEVAHRKLIESLPNIFFKNNPEFCFSKFDKEVYPKFISKFFIYDEDKNVDFEEIKATLELAKTKINESFDHENIFQEIKINECWDGIITTLPTEFVKSNSEFIITLIERKISGKARDYLLNNIPEDVIRKYENKFDNKITVDNIGAYQKYLEYIISNPEMSIITSNIGIKIFEFINSNPNNNNPEFLRIKNAVEQEKSKYEFPEMSKYATYLPKNYSEQFNLMNNDVFESFINDLEKIKLLNGRIPEEYCDYIIKQKLTTDSPLNQNLDKYLPMLKRAFEDKVQHMLTKEGIEGYSIEFFEKDGDTLGYHNKTTRKIGFLEDNLIELGENNTHIINTAFHEVKHGIQSKDSDTTEFSKLNGSLYNMIKEEIIRADEIGFYRRNYTRMYCEIDARLAGAKGQAEYLRYLGVPEEQIIEDVGSSQITLKEIVEKNMEEEATNIEYASNKVDSEGRIVSISQKAAELIKKNPDWLKKYPVLSLEFDENGERKKTAEILSNAIKCKDDSVKDIYMKMFELDITVSLEDSAETLDYISRLLETKEGYSEDIVAFTNLIIRNEVFSSLRDVDINDIECQRVLAMLNKISTNNPNLKISDYINEMLNNISHDGKINLETKKDKELSDSAVSTMLSRKVKSIEEFDSLLQDLQKVIVDKEKYDWNLIWGFENFFEKQFKKQSELDFILMFEKTLETLSEANRENFMSGFWEKMPEDMKKNHLKSFVDTCSKYKKIDFEFAYKTMSQMNLKDIRENPTLADETFGEHIPSEILPFLKFAQNGEELDEIIAEARSRGADNVSIRRGIDFAVRTEIQRENPNSKEMLYSQLEFLGNKYNRAWAMSIFFIYADKSLVKKDTEQILRHTLIEKDYFDEEDVTSVIDNAKKNIGDEFFKENPDMLPIIDEIHRQALEKTKQTNLVVDEISVDLEPETPKDVVSATDTEKEEVLALQEIRDSVPANEISTGKKMIQMFLTKAKEMKNKIGKFFGGGDDHDNR